jgi:hypothetical protein
VKYIKGKENITQNKTTSNPENFDSIGSPLNKKWTNKIDKEAYKSPIKNIFQGPFSALFGLINDSNIPYKEKEIF